MPAHAEIPITEKNALIFYDGDCATCQRFIRFVLDRDKKRVFRYASLQGETARRLLPGSYTCHMDTLVFFLPATKSVSDRSSALLAILSHLGGTYFLISMLGRIIPRLPRDFVYKQWAQQRHRFSRRCRLLSAEERRLFLP